ncbi:hypothetical protein BDR26DRAFT_862045 [Obelidium mucronatum]|nr:hypothetical protein BDR26DRAFT_862045 [Obelidium mucronatum]
MNTEAPPCVCGKVAGASRSAVCRSCKVRFHQRCISKEPNVPYICVKCSSHGPLQNIHHQRLAMKSPKVGMKAPKVGMKSPKFGMKSPAIPASVVASPKVAMKSPRVHLPTVAPLLMMDEDDDLCPVCDGDCTCNSVSKPVASIPPPVTIPFKQAIPTPRPLSAASVSAPTIPGKISNAPKSLQRKPLATSSTATKSKPANVESSKATGGTNNFTKNPSTSFQRGGKTLPKTASSSSSASASVLSSNQSNSKISAPSSTKPAPTKLDEAASRRMLTCLADLVVDAHGNAWKAKTTLKKPGSAREFGKMTHTPSADILKSAPRMERVGTSWIVKEVAPLPSNSSVGSASQVAKKSKPKSIKNSIFDSSSDSDSDDQPLRLHHNSKLAAKGLKGVSRVIASAVDESSSDMDEAIVFSDSDLDSGPATERGGSVVRNFADTDESGNELSVTMAGPPFVEQHTSDDSNDDSSSDSDGENASVGSLADFLSEHSDDMDIDMIFANAETETGSDASESDIDMFVENALYGGWSSSDEFEDSDEDSIFGIAGSEGGSAPSITHSEENAFLQMDLGETDTTFLDSADVANLLDGFTTISTDIHTLDPVLDDPSFLNDGTDPLPVTSDQPEIIPPPPVAPPPKPLVSFDITQTHIGPNGEIITTTKQLSLPVQKPKPPKKPKKGSDAASQATRSAASNEKATKPAEKQVVEAATTAPPTPAVSSPALAALQSALSSIVLSSGGQKNSQLVNAMIASLKTLGTATSAGNSLASLLEPKKSQDKSSKTEDSSNSNNPAANIAALAVIAAAVAAAKGKLKKSDSGGSGSFSGQDAAVIKALEDFLTTALPALSNLQKQQPAATPAATTAPVAAKSSSKAATGSTGRQDITLEDLFDTEALESDGAPDDYEHGIEELDLSDPFSRWTKVPILTFRKSRRPSLSKVAKNDFKKAFRNSKYSPTMTLPSAPMIDYAAVFYKSPKFTATPTEYAPNALLQIPPFPNIPHFPSPLLPANHGFSESKDIPELNLSDDVGDLFHGGFEAQTGDKKWKVTNK